MKVLLINGSPRIDGNTKIALKEVEKTLNEEGVETEIIDVGNHNISGCKACGACYKTGQCVIKDLVNDVNEKFEGADGIVVGSPVYYASPNGTLISFLDRLFYSSRFSKRFKVGASVAVARRGGTSTTFDVLNKYFTINEMPVVSSTYWNNVHGASKGEVSQDLEGLQCMRNLGKNMAFLIKSINLGKKEFGEPKKEKVRERTNFIR